MVKGLEPSGNSPTMQQRPTTPVPSQSTADVVSCSHASCTHHVRGVLRSYFLCALLFFGGENELIVWTIQVSGPKFERANATDFEPAIRFFWPVFLPGFCQTD